MTLRVVSTSQTDPKGDLTKFAYGAGATGQTTTTVSVYPAGSSNPPDVTEYDYWNNVLTSEVTGVDTGDPAVKSFPYATPRPSSTRPTPTATATRVRTPSPPPTSTPPGLRTSRTS